MSMTSIILLSFALMALGLWGFYLIRLAGLASDAKVGREAFVLAVLLFVGAGLAGGFALMQVWWVQEVRVTQGAVARISTTRMLMQNLLAESMEYRKTHPSIDPILQSLNLLATNAPQPASSGAPAAGSAVPSANR